MIKQNDFANKQREKNKEDASKHKKMLQKRMINKLSATKDKEEHHEDKMDTSDYKKLYRDAKSSLEKITKEYNSVKNKIKEDEHIEREYKNEISILKKRVFELENENKNLVSQSEKDKALIIEKETAILNLKKKLETTEEDLNKSQYRLRSANDRNNDLQRILDSYKEEVKEYYGKQIEEYKSRTKEYEDIINKHLRKFEKLHEQIREYKVKLKSYEDLDPETMIQELYDKLSLDNVFEYHLSSSLHRKYKMTKRYAFRQRRDNISDDIHFNDDVEYGYIKNKEDRFVFVSLLNQEYEINYHVGNKLINGVPCSVFLNEDNTVDVFWFYETDSEMLKDVKMNNKNKKTRKNNKKSQSNIEYEYIGDFKVLILTSENGIRYRNRLEHHGIIATWADPFEKSPVHIKTLMKTNDIVLMCVENMPHFILDLIDDQNDKYQIITNHNEDVIVSRSRYAALQLGLI